MDKDKKLNSVVGVGYYPGLNVLRSICAILIVLFHYTAQYNQSIYTIDSLKHGWPVVVPWGSAAVVTFFLLSGFLTNLDKGDKPFTYLKKRVVRLYPTYLACMFITCIVTGLFYKEAFVGIKDILINLTMLPSLLGARPVDGVTWTLQYEIFFYIIIAILLFVNKPKLNNWFFACWSVFNIAIYFMITALGNNIVFKALNLLLFPKYSHIFILGIALKRISTKKYDVLTLSSAVASIVNSYFWLGLMQTLWLVGSAVIIMYITMFYPRTFLNSQNKVSKFFAWFASITYALYLVHQNVGYAIIRGMISAGMTSQWFMFIPILVSVALAWLVTQFVEKPITKFFNRKKQLKEEK